MKHAIAVVAVLLLAMPAAAQVHAKRDARESRMDLIGPSARAARAAAARADARSDAAAFAATGDADAFGRSLKYLGVAQTLTVLLQPDCSGSSPDYERCLVPAAAPEMTFFDFGDLARIDLPAKATSSLICYTLTPFMLFEFWNGTGMPQWGANFTARADITIENPVLADPTLVDPMTGEPYLGKLVVSLGTYNESRSLGVDEYAYKRLTLTRACIGGLISKAALRDQYGLSDAQATEFFKQPMTFRFGASGLASFVDWANYFYGIRLYGD